MIAVVCVDNRFGMMFHHRRLSRDRILIEKLIETVSASGSRLLIDAYSAPLFPADFMPIVSPSFLDEAGEHDYCFVENRELLPYLDKINGLIVFHYHRDYPSDTKLDLDPNILFSLVRSYDFAGSSHEKITCEEYRL